MADRVRLGKGDGRAEVWLATTEVGATDDEREVAAGAGQVAEIAAIRRPERLHDPGMPLRHRHGTIVIQGPPGSTEGHHQKVAPVVPLVFDESNVAAVG